MSAIALSWVSKITVGNANAKHLLLFLSSHSFNKPGFYFSIDTLSKQLEVSESSVRRSLKILMDLKLIDKEDRYDQATGQQLTNAYFLNIPDEFVDSFFSHSEKGSQSDRGGVTVTGGGCHSDRGEGVTVTPKYININNKGNKRERTQRAPLSDSFYPDQKRLNLANQTAQRVGIGVDDLLTKFKNVKRSHQSDDWQRDLETFLISERVPLPSISRGSSRESGLPRSNEVRCTVPEWRSGNAKEEQPFVRASKTVVSEQMRHIRGILKGHVILNRKAAA